MTDRYAVMRAIDAITQEMVANKEFLIELDSRNGDGDLGISMVEGFSAVRRYLAVSDVEDIGKLFMQCGMTFNEAAPSSLGTIISFGFLGMGKSLRGHETITFEQFAQAFDDGIKNIKQRAKSNEGEKTILDALCPASRAFMAYVGDPETALRIAAAAAENGSDATRDMSAVHGRAARYPGGSLGLIDGGAVAGALIVKGIMEAGTKEERE